MKKIEHFLLETANFTEDWAYNISVAVSLIGLLLCSWLVHKIAREILVLISHRFAKKTKTTWDDELVKHSVFKRLAHTFPAILIYFVAPHIFKETSFVFVEIKIAVYIYLWLITTSVLFAILNTVRSVFMQLDHYKDKPISSYIQLTKIVIGCITGILIVSILAGQSPLLILTGIGTLSAVLILVFKDTILGFVASLQIAANDIVRVGDWVTVDKYGADGDIEEINLATIKIRNFDRTTTTVPTYAIISDSFKNWRGMEESGGRRIKRAVYINKNSIHFLSPQEIEDLKKIQLLKPYLNTSTKEIEAFNTKNNFDTTTEVNGRKLTNIGVFRKYLELYIKQNPNINTEMACMVRQLPPIEIGLPIEIYAFCKNKEWAAYESIMADIFDHILAIIYYFNLSLFQNPTGLDFQRLTQHKLEE